MINPSFWGVVWPVLRRHQSTPKLRASATMSCFFRLPTVRGSMIYARHFLQPRYSGWNFNNRQASSFKVQRNLGLPHLVMGPNCCRGPELF